MRYNQTIFTLWKPDVDSLKQGPSRVDVNDTAGWWADLLGFGANLPKILTIATLQIQAVLHLFSRDLSALYLSLE